MIVTVDTTNVHRDEIKELKSYLEDNCWKTNELTADELKGITELIYFVIAKRLTKKSTHLSNTELINLRNKFKR